MDEQNETTEVTVTKKWWTSKTIIVAGITTLLGVGSAIVEASTTQPDFTWQTAWLVGVGPVFGFLRLITKTGVSK